MRHSRAARSRQYRGKVSRSWVACAPIELTARNYSASDAPRTHENTEKCSTSCGFMRHTSYPSSSKFNCSMLSVIDGILVLARPVELLAARGACTRE